MIPGKTYKPEDFVQMAWRRKWIMVIPLVVFGTAATLWSQKLPNRYRSDVVIMIVPPRISEKIVDQDMNTTLSQRLQSLQRRLLSRSVLERIVQDLDLYAEERKTMLMEQVIAQMATQDIKVNVVKGKGRRGEPNNFTVSFECDNPRTAMQVADRLASLFLNANLEDREQHAVSNAEFLRAQADEARKKLLEQEKKVEAYKRAFGGELPSQQGANLHGINSATAELQMLAEKLNRDRDKQLEIQNLLNEQLSVVVQASLPTPAKDGKDGKDGPTAATAADQLEQARATLRGMRLRFKAGHPDVAAAERQIAELEKKAEAEALQQPLSGGGQPTRVLSSGEASRQMRIVQMRTELQNLERRMASYQAEEKRLQGLLADYRARVDRAPSREVELSELQRDHETLRNTYTSYLKRVQESEVALSLERGQVGEQLRVVDPARIPERPSGPNRFRFSLIGLLGGFALGVAIAGLLEYRDTTLRTEGDVVVALSLPVVATIPTMLTTSERSRFGRRRLAMLSACAVTVIVSAAALVWKLRLFEAWIR